MRRALAVGERRAKPLVGAADGPFGALAARAARCVDLDSPHLGGDLVEHAVDVLVAVGAAEALGELDRLVDRDLVRNLDAAHELERAEHQRRVLDRREQLDLAIDVRGERGVDRLGFADRAVQQQVEVPAVASPKAFLPATVRAAPAGVAAVEQPLVEALERELARAPTRRLGVAAASDRAPTLQRRGVLLVGAHESSSSRLAISTAARAASRPFCSARASACAGVSHVRIALATAMPWSMATRVTAAPLSLATSSKWYVSPRRTQPTAISASCSSPSAIALSATPISSAPGTRTCVTSSSPTPSLASSSTQARAIRSVSSTLKRAWTTATRSSLPSRRAASPRSALRMARRARRGSVVADEAGDLEPVARQARHAARAAEQPHAA